MRAPKNFVSLHSHSGFSALDGLDPPEAHIDFVRNNGMDGWCLTEHGHMNSYAQAYLYTQKLNKEGANFKFVPGCELYLHPDLQQWDLHRKLAAAAKDGDRSAIRTIKNQLGQFKRPIVPLLDEDDDIVGVGFEGEDEGSNSTITVESESESKTVDAGRFSNPVRRRHHLVVLPRTSQGLQNLFSLVSRGYREGFFRFPRVDYSMLKQAAQGGHLIASTACLAGPVSFSVFEIMQSADVHALSPQVLDDPNLRAKIMRNIGNTWEQLTDAVGHEFAFLEMQFNRLPAQHLVNRSILEFASDNGLMDRLVVTADSHYPSPERWRDREVYKGLGYSSWKELGPDSLPLSQDDLKCELYPKNADQLWQEYLGDKEQFSWYEGFEDQVIDAIERPHSIVHDLIEDIKPDISVKLPKSIIPPKKNPLSALIERCKEGLKRRGVEGKPEYIDRLKTELATITDKGFELYFLTEQRIMQMGKEVMFCGPGRGSAAGSLVCWLLEITDVDPIEWGLSFERFLSPSRTDLPDVDSDFEDRDEMVNILQREFGEENVIPISSYGRMQISTSTKDVARLLNVPYEEVNAATRGLDQNVKGKVAGKGEAKANVDVTYELAYEHHQAFRELMDRHPDLATMVSSLGKQIKSIGRHAGGVLVSENVPERMPVILSKGRLQTPWIEGLSGKHLEPLGWVKFDILGLETLSILRRSIEMVLEREGVKKPSFEQVRAWFDANLDPKVINWNDRQVYKHVYEDGRWFGVFQCTNAGAQRFFRRAKPKSIIDIATLTSIFRPGPLGANVDKMYVGYKSDPTTIPDMHPKVWQVLEKTYGLLIFQEQVMELAHVVADVPLEECDDIRRAITKGKKENLGAVEQRFLDGAMKNGLTETEARELFGNIKYFSGYGFNKSHAVSYAMVSYWCAWMLTYHPDEWICAWCESMSTSAEDRAVAFRTVRQWGGEIRSIDARYATDKWRIIEPGVYMPALSAASGVGTTALRELIKYRPFGSMRELLFGDGELYRLSKLNKKALESLIRIGAFNCFVGPDKEFSSVNHMLEVVVKGGDALRKSLKKNPTKGRDTYDEWLLTKRDVPPRTREQRIKDQQDILGMVDPNLILTQRVREFFLDHEIPCIDDVSEEEAALCWFVVGNATIKKTKAGKPYLQLQALDASMGEYRINIWSFTGKKGDVPKPWSLVVGKLRQDDWGWKGFWDGLKILDSSKFEEHG